MKRAIRVLAVAVLIALPVACLHHASASSFESNFATVRIVAGGQVLSTGGQPYSGTLIARDEEINAVAESVLAGTPLAGATELDTRGLILEVPVVDGALSGRAVLRADLRSPELSEELTDRPDQFVLTVARQLAPTVEVAEATFEAGKLEGSAVIFAPVAGSTGRVGPIAKAEFHDNQLDGIAREYSASTERLLREITFVHGQPSGPQRNYYASGALERDVMFLDGRPHGVMTEYYEDGAKRAETTFEDGEVVGTRRRWFPTGQLQLEVTADGTDVVMTQWYSNGDMKSRVSPEGEVEYPPDGSSSTITGTEPSTRAPTMPRGSSTALRRSSTRAGPAGRRARSEKGSGMAPTRSGGRTGSWPWTRPGTMARS